MISLHMKLVLGLACLAAAASANLQPGLRGIVFYTYDQSFTGADLVVQELKGDVLKSLLAAREYVSKPKPISSSYEFFGLLDGRCDIQLKCEKKECAKVEQQSCPAPKVCEACVKPKCAACQPCEKVKLCSNGAPDSAYPDCCTNGGKGKYCCTNGENNPGCTPAPKCKNGAPDSAFPDCCKNGGKGKYCCTNGYDNPGCVPPPTPKLVTPTPAPPKCKNGAPDSAFPDCCKNGGKGQYCCTNGLNVPGCTPPTIANTYLPVETTPTIPSVKKLLCKNGAPDSAYPDCCTNGGKGKYCCTNGENNPGCTPPPKCKNGAPDSAFPDCCKNGGIGKYCCTNGFNNPKCSPEIKIEPLCKNGAPDTAYPDCCKNGGKGKYCCTNGFDNPGCTPPPIITKTPDAITIPPTQRTTTRTTTTRLPIITKKTSTRGPPYLPQPSVATTPGTPWTGTYRPDTGTFRQTHTWEPFVATGTWIPRPTQSFAPITLPPKYVTKVPFNSIVYES